MEWSLRRTSRTRPCRPMSLRCSFVWTCQWWCCLARHPTRPHGSYRTPRGQRASQAQHGRLLNAAFCNRPQSQYSYFPSVIRRRCPGDCQDRQGTTHHHGCSPRTIPRSLQGTRSTYRSLLSCFTLFRGLGGSRHVSDSHLMVPVDRLPQVI